MSIFTAPTTLEGHGVRLEPMELEHEAALQAAIERLGAKRDGVIRRYQVRRDGTIRDTVMYSVTAEEWHQGIKAHLGDLLRD